jgi:hypothetical protein
MKCCSVDGCPATYYAKGLCRAHYARAQRGADLSKPFQEHIPDRGCLVDDCDRPHDAHGYCSLHRQRWERFGDPLRENVIASPGNPEAFFQQALKCTSDECLIWPYGRDNRGYAQMSWRKRGKAIKKVYCAVCEEVHGTPPTPKHEAAHSCGNGHLGCINPRHLRWLTHKENLAEMRAHGRGANGYGPY